jgi:signal transduction histidine kinase
MTTPPLPIAPVQALLFAPALGLAALAPAIALPQSPLVSSATIAVAVGLAKLGGRLWLAALALAMLAWALYRLATAGFDPYLWLAIAALAVAAAMPREPRLTMPRFSLDMWGGIIALGSIAMIVALLVPGPPGYAAGFIAMMCTGLVSIASARRLIPVDGQRDAGLALLTRDLLLGRITSGLLHDLSQPLNVISMANGNLDYIVERLDVPDEQRSQLIERTRRIAANTDRAAQVLGLFRWFGRDGSRDHGMLTIATSLDRAVTVVKADLNMGDLDVEIRGDALDYPVLLRHGTVEMLVVAALLGSCRTLAQPGERQTAGSVLIDAGQTERDIVLTIGCRGEGETAASDVDDATMWLVARLAREGGGDFRRVGGRDEAPRFVIRFPREVI